MKPLGRELHWIWWSAPSVDERMRDRCRRAIRTHRKRFTAELERRERNFDFGGMLRATLDPDRYGPEDPDVWDDDD